MPALKPAVLASLALLAAPAAAAPCADCAAAYRALAERRGLQIDPEHRTGAQPLALDPETRDAPTLRLDIGDLDVMRWILFVLAFVILAAIVSMVARGPNVALRRLERERAPRKPEAPTAEAAETDGVRDPGRLEALLRMRDRRAALRLLQHRLVAHGAAAAGVKAGRSWTAREVVRAMPRSWPHFDAFRSLIRETELGWFGGRPVDDARFSEMLARARPILSDETTR